VIIFGFSHAMLGYFDDSDDFRQCPSACKPPPTTSFGVLGSVCVAMCAGSFRGVLATAAKAVSIPCSPPLILKLALSDRRCVVTHLGVKSLAVSGSHPTACVFIPPPFSPQRSLTDRRCAGVWSLILASSHWLFLDPTPPPVFLSPPLLPPKESYLPNPTLSALVWCWSVAISLGRL